MLRAIKLENFKAFARPEELELRPLTVFCGPNAAGKSSVIQALLMMKQTLNEQSDGESVALVTNGEDVSLGDYANIVSGHDLGRDLGTKLTVALDGAEGGVWETPGTLALVLRYHIPFGYNPGQYLNRVARPDISDLSLIVEGADGRELARVSMYDSVVVPEDEEHYGFTVDLTFGEHMNHTARHFEGPELGIEHIADLFKMTTPDGVTLTEWDDDCGANELAGLVSRMLYEVSSRLKIRYISPAREAPERYYDAETLANSNGPDRRGGSDWKTALVEDRPSGPRPPDDPGSIFVYGPYGLVNDWLRYLGLPKVNPVREGRDFRVMVSSPYIEEYSVSVADTGYGVSQVLPILVAGLERDEETLVLDQPELHLHPKGQTGMADFAIALAKGHQVRVARAGQIVDEIVRSQVLVETHSDHFVNRIVRRVVEGEIHSDDVAVYFITATSDAGPHVEMVEVDPTFGIKNWPLGFFDDYSNEQEAIIRASIERRSRENE